MKTLFTFLLLAMLPGQSALAQKLDTTTQPWPHPIPARIHDGANKDIAIMTLGDVRTGLADGVFDPLKDEMRLTDGTVMPNYYKEKLGDWVDAKLFK